MKALNQQRLKNIPFDEYLKLPGFSHSGIKMAGRTPKPPTAKMGAGTCVHNYLLEPHKYEHLEQSYKRIAAALKYSLGALWEYLEPEVAVTADFVHEGFIMPYKGRIDLSVKNRVVIDCKVINGTSVWQTLRYFGYDNQVSGYAVGDSARDAFIAAYSTKTEKVEIVKVPIVTTWWEEQIFLNGNEL